MTLVAMTWITMAWITMAWTAIVPVVTAVLQSLTKPWYLNINITCRLYKVH